MTDYSATVKLPVSVTRAFAAARIDLQSWRERFPLSARSPMWQAIVVVPIALGLLLAFHHVVRGAVRQSEFLQHTSALNAEASWRCQVMPGPHDSKSCLMSLNALSRSEAILLARSTKRSHP